ncbi:hypothetical protein DL767_004900 [Monosporascus sp. MG133]|nr:hypothetical protein DL767_004900 [Monosporascus sp. MG133]
MSDPKQLGQPERGTTTEPKGTAVEGVTQSEPTLGDGNGKEGVAASNSGTTDGSNIPQKSVDPIRDEEAPLPVQESRSGRKEKEKVTDVDIRRSSDRSADPAVSTEAMESSVSTLKPSKPQYLTIQPPPYIDPTPPTPSGSQPPSRTSSTHRCEGSVPEPSPTRSDIGYDEKRFASDDENESSSRSEIDTIMGQFPEGGGGPGEEEVMSPRLEIASPLLTGPPAPHPPRKSSLEPLASTIAQQLQGLQFSNASATSVTSKDKAPDSEDQGPPVPPKDDPADGRSAAAESSVQNAPLHRPPPPEPEPEPALPFDFHRFLEQLKHKKADPVARYLKSFLFEFGKRQWMVHEQVKIISDFLAFIANKMAQCEVWSDVSDAEFDNAREGMEKLVMNRLYTQTFSPAIPPPQPIPGAKPRRRGGERPMGPGRRGQHQEDVERDEVLAQKISIYGWVREEHLDIPPVELLKIKSYRAPRDKIICVLNCCKVIFVSNVQYILRFRNQEKLGGEAGYYLSSLMGAVQFIENMDRTTLTISDEEFEKNVEAAVSAIAEKHRAEEAATATQPSIQEKSGLHPSGASSTRPSLDLNGSGTHRRSLSSDDNDSDEGAAFPGLLRTIQKPLSTIGRIFSDDASGAGPSTPARTPLPESGQPSPRPSTDGQSPMHLRQQLSAEEAAARQASAEVAEAQRIHRAEHNNVVETLAGMFPDLDRDVISDVVYQKEGRVGLAVDACLALSA